ncbi:MAG: endonuclease III domain-containing protein [Candidatus Aenigmarchaeota archaeon]|nr:endonuclease III domain-containing protein [Candidatus Aenigmarchaeota archaeon]MDW7986668.1 endonuclease III domain-containing protein [Nitrososphaerota archaeon]MDW8149656.1 endonuclease III domain-containing protein [Candidatus Aenigmarchaeota archaeon]
MKIHTIYKILLNHFGKQFWWPAETKFEIITGAILTQQTSWKNVEIAIRRLKIHKKLTPKAIYEIPLPELEEIIKPSGFYKIKARRLKNFVNFLFENYDGDLNKLSSLDESLLRKQLLSVNGIGKETADAIMLYAFDKLSFVVDGYTIRIFSRLGLINEIGYERVKRIFETNLPKNVEIYKEYHALIVELGKNFCRKIPKCLYCPLKKRCKYANNYDATKKIGKKN